MSKTTDKQPTEPCASCGRTDLQLTITLNTANMQRRALCSVCLHKYGVGGNLKRKPDMKRLDAEIAEYEDLATKFEAIIREHPEPDDPDSPFAKYAMTPMSSYKSIQAVLGELRTERMEALTRMDSETRLKYELKKSLEKEDYLKSAEIRDQLEGKKKGGK